MTELSSAVRDLMRPTYRRVAARLPLPLRRRYLHDLGVGRIGNFKDPQTFNEKVNWRILHDRRPQLVAVCDKERMKQIARDHLPESELRISETYWLGTQVDQVPAAVLERPYVAKPNHSSGKVVFGPMPAEELRQQTRGWLENTQAKHLGEWGYAHARARIMIEERLPCEGAPTDYKFFTFAGVPRLIQVDTGRFGNHLESFYDPQWQRLPVRDARIAAADMDRPAGLERMLEIATVLGAGWDFLRVDLYDLAGEIWFGELSPYPGGGVTRWDPASFDRELGQHWQLPTFDEVREGQGPQ